MANWLNARNCRGSKTTFMLNQEEKKIQRGLFSKLHEWICSGKIKTTKELPDETIIACTAIEDGNYKELNRFWHLDDNKSYPRKAFCSRCQRQVMMSNWLYKEYKKNKKLGRTNPLVCGKCLFSITKD